MREIDIIEYLLSLNPELKASYDLYHLVRHCIKVKDISLLKNALKGKDHTVSNYMKTAIQSLRKYIDYVENTLKYNYTNGILEGINNKIKVIKRIAFGYRSFYHFKNRILINQNLAVLKKA